jgi:FtsH-binding integral membrane protein
MFTSIIILSILLLVIVYFIAYFDTKRISENIYITNTYLYIFGSIIVISLTCLIIDKYNLFKNISPLYIFGIVIVSFLTLFGTILTSPNQYYIKNICYIIFVITLGILIFNIYKLASNKNILLQILLIIGVMFTCISILFNLYPIEQINTSGPYLLFALFGLIIFEISDLIFGSKEGLSYRSRIYAWIGMFIFSGFLIYDTQQIKKNYNSNPDYPVQSLSIVLDTINLFSNIVIIKS